MSVNETTEICSEISVNGFMILVKCSAYTFHDNDIKDFTKTFFFLFEKHRMGIRTVHTTGHSLYVNDFQCQNIIVNLCKPFVYFCQSVL